MRSSTIQDLVLQLDDVIETNAISEQAREELQSIRQNLLGLVNPQAPNWGIWEYEQQPTNDPGLNGFMHVVRIPSTADKDQYLEVTFYKGATDGKPVVQIDGQGDFRINVNDEPIWDADPNNHSHEACGCTQKED